MSHDIDNYTEEEQDLAYQTDIKINIGVLVQIVRLIDITIERGSFKAAECTHVGALYDSISKGVNQALVNARKNLRLQKSKKREPLQVSVPIQQPVQQQYSAQNSSQNFSQNSSQNSAPPQYQPLQVQYQQAPSGPYVMDVQLDDDLIGEQFSLTE